MLKSIGFIKFIVLFILFSILLSTCQMPVRPMTDNLKKDLIFGHLNYDQYDYQTVIDSINKDKTDSKISIQELEIKDDNSIKTFTTQADIILLKGINPATFQGYLNLEPLIQSDQTFSKNDFLPNSLNACADENGNQYGIPIWVYLTGIYYNPQLFTMKRFVKCFFELLTQIIVKVRKCKVQRVCVLHFQLAGSGGCFFLMKLYH